MRRWDIFCAVVDNFGDIGVCWRLARELAAEHAVSVRLWVDDLATFAQLCPLVRTDAESQQVGAIEVRKWMSDFSAVEAADVVVEAFACQLPERYVERMAAREGAPVWINLEYLSAEDWVENCHQIPSPQPQWGLTKYFFFPGFTPQTGGLLRERKLQTEFNAFDTATREQFWQQLGLDPPRKAELRISLFCYENPALPELLRHWEQSTRPITVLATAGAATEQCRNYACDNNDNSDCCLPPLLYQRGNLTIHALPFLEHSDFDRLLWACDVNLVRGEDSFVRAQWARRPFVWQPYVQPEDAHLVKLQAFLDRYLAAPSANESAAATAAAIRNLWFAWNETGQIGAEWDQFERHLAAIERLQVDWITQLDRVGELTNNLARFAAEMERRGLADPHS